MSNEQTRGSPRPHLTAEQRLRIENMLNDRASLGKIADVIGKARSTVSREIRERRVKSLVGAVGRVPNRCIHRRECTKTQVCLDQPNCTRRCSTCKWCNSHCPEYEEEKCGKLKEPPYVCNGCGERAACTLEKQFYSHKKAQEDYKKTLSDSRAGINMTTRELASLDRAVSPLIKKGQSIHHMVD